MLLFSFSCSHQTRAPHLLIYAPHTMSYTTLVSASSRSDNKIAQAQLPAWGALTPWGTQNVEEYGFWMQQNLSLLFLSTGWCRCWRPRPLCRHACAQGTELSCFREDLIGWLWGREESLLYKEEKITSLQGIPNDSKINVISVLFSGCWWEQWSW